MRRLGILAFVAVLLSSIVAASEAGNGGSLAQAVAPFLEEQTLAVVAVDLSRVDAAGLTPSVFELAGVAPEEMAEARQAVSRLVGDLRKAGAKEAALVISLADLTADPFVLVPLGNGADAVAIEKLLRGLEQGKLFAFVKRERDVLFAGSESSWQRLHNNKPTPRPEFAAALANIEKKPVRILIALSADTKRSFEENAPNLPAELGGGPITALTHGIQWAALGIDLAPRLTVQLVIQSADGKAARTLADAMESALKQLGKNEKWRRAFPNYDALVNKLTPQVQGDRLTLDAGEGIVAEVIGPLAAKMRQQASWTQDANNLKQIALAMHNYYDVHHSFPPPAIYKDGKALLSWRVALLPYLDQLKLYKQFHLDEPWDSEHNKPLLARMPEVFHSPARRTPAGKTPYEVLVGEGTMFRGPKGVTFREITDGTSNTIMVFETDEKHAVDWTRPEDVLDNPGQAPVDAIGRGHPWFVVAFADGSGRRLPTAIDPKLLRAMFTRSAGDTVDFSKLP